MCKYIDKQIRYRLPTKTGKGLNERSKSPQQKCRSKEEQSKEIKIKLKATWSEKTGIVLQLKFTQV